MKIITIVVAITNHDLEQSKKCISSIDRNLFDVIIVCPANYHKSISKIISESASFKIITTDLTSIRGLWQQGEKSSVTPWIVFVQSSDILTVQLQKNIDQGCRHFIPRDNYRYDLQRISIFLKRRLKYCHFWTNEPIPHIKFKRLSPIRENDSGQTVELNWPSPMGELIHYRPDSILKAIPTVSFFIEEYSDNLFHLFPNLNKKNIFIQAAKESLKSLLGGFFLKKWIRDGYEGFIFSFFDIFITCFGYLRYYEKYIRSGRKLLSEINLFKNILLLNVNGIGDSVSLPPIIRNIKERLPNAKIDILVNTLAKGVLENNPYVNNIYTSSRLPHNQEIKNIAKNLKSFNYDLIVNMRSRNSTEKLVGLLSGRWKININHYSREKATDVMVGFKKNDLPYIHNELEFLKEIGFEPKKYQPEIFLKNEEIESSRHFLDANDCDSSRKLVIFHPFLSDPIRDWGIDKYIDLANRLDKAHNCNIMFIGSKSEIDGIRSRIRSEIPRCVLYDDSVRKTISIINESSLFIGGDTSFSHIAPALNIPTIVILGPLWPPYMGVHWDKDFHINNKNVFIFHKDVSCRDLLNTACASCSDQICFDFSIDDILKQILKMLN